MATIEEGTGQTDPFLRLCGKQAVPSSLPNDVKHHLAGFDQV